MDIVVQCIFHRFSVCLQKGLGLYFQQFTLVFEILASTDHTGPGREKKKSFLLLLILKQKTSTWMKKREGSLYWFCALPHLLCNDGCFAMECSCWDVLDKTAIFIKMVIGVLALDLRSVPCIPQGDKPILDKDKGAYFKIPAF